MHYMKGEYFYYVLFELFLIVDLIIEQYGIKKGHIFNYSNTYIINLKYNFLNLVKIKVFFFQTICITYIPACLVYFILFEIQIINY